MIEHKNARLILKLTVHKDVFGRLTERHERDVDEPQRLIDHLQRYRNYQYDFLLVGCIITLSENGIWCAQSH
jgi:hypothetical protein